MLPDQTLLIHRTGKPRAKIDVLGANRRSDWQCLSSRPDLLSGCLFTVVVCCYSVTDEFLEVERTFLHPRVHLAIDEDSGIEILLREIAKIFVFGHNPFVNLVDELEVLFGRVLVAKNLIPHQRTRGPGRHESLYEEEVRSVPMLAGRSAFQNDATHETFIDALGKK